MKTKFFWIFSMIVSISCGVSKEEEKKKLDKITIEYDPAPGVYSFKPWVILKKPEDSFDSLYVKAPGETEFKNTLFGCLDAPYQSGSAATKQGTCVEVKESGQLAYYLESGSVKSDEKKVEYTVNLTTNNVSVETKALSTETAQSFQLTESETHCKYISDDKLQIIIQSSNTEKLTSAKTAYIGLLAKNPANGSTTKYTKDSDSELGMVIKPVSDDVPTFITLLTYSTKPGTDTGSWPESFCETKVEVHERGRSVKGTFECSGLRSRKSSPEKSDEPLDKMVSLKGSWQCDYSAHLN